jgi:hypothetical protein
MAFGKIPFPVRLGKEGHEEHADGSREVVVLLEILAR